MDAYRDLIARIGVFFLVTGAFLFILFVSSDVAKKPDFDYLFLALLALGLGWFFGRRKPAPPAAGRFGMIRKAREDAKKRREARAKEKK
jgi:hypothetical protein